MAENPQFDVVVTGGGLAGLTLAIQLKQERPATSVLVLERGRHPFPDAAFKVGESTVEMGGQYLVRLLGEDYFESKHIRKAGPRFFFPAEGNEEISRRVEYGTSTFLPIHSYQVDRGRLENRLWATAIELGVDVRGECKVEDVELAPDSKTVSFTEEGSAEPRTATARWIVDASGRTGFLKKKLGLAEPAEHEPNAAWFRLEEPMDLSDWSDDQAWKTALPPGHRFKATSHLMGPGYWVWFIPLPSGSTSVGVVAHPDFVPLKRINTFERVLEWLQENEPQCARVIESKRAKLQDFNCVKHYAYGCQRVFSPERWCLTGEAGVFIDPFLSPGTDFIGLSNSMISAAIVRDLDGEDVGPYVEFTNQLYLGLYQLVLGWFRALYPMLGNHQVMVLWIAWYFLLYMSIPVTLFLHRRLWSMEFMGSIQAEIGRFRDLSLRGIALLQAFGERYREPGTGHFVDIMKLDHIVAMQRELVSGETLTDDQLRQRIRRNLGLIEATLVEYFDRMARLLAIHPEKTEINPYAVGLDPSRWEEDGLFSGTPAVRDAGVTNNVGAIWYASRTP